MSIRVMIVDDSSVMRRLVTIALRPATDIEVVAVAANGREALELIPTWRPDLVTLDVEMPEMDGLATMQAIHAAHPELPVIMFCGLTEQNAVTTINALRAGALDYITKPVASSSDEALTIVHDQLVPKIRVLGLRGHLRPARRTIAVAESGPTAEPDSPAVAAGGVHPPPTEPAVTVVPVGLAPAPPGTDRRQPKPGAAQEESRFGAVSVSSAASTRARAAVRVPPRVPARRSGAGSAPESGTGRFAVVAIGVSTGGPVALERTLEMIPADFPAPLVIVQHMPPLFTKIMAERLDIKCALHVREAGGGEELQAGDVWLAPGGMHLEVVEGRHGPTLALDDGPPVRSCKPAVDVLFRSLAAVFGARVLAVVMTGMGADGTDGAHAVAAAGGEVIAQDEASSAVWGMPGSVVARGLADLVVPLDEMAMTIVHEANRRRSSSAPAPSPH